MSASMTSSGGTANGAGTGRLRKVGLVLRPERDLHTALDEICAWAADSGVSLLGSDREARLPGAVERRPEGSLAADADIVLALGGDGTMLGAMRMAAPHGVPVLGINLGRLGYLTEVDAAHLRPALEALAKREYTIESRTALALGARDGMAAQI